jgi:hypothetical protein
LFYVGEAEADGATLDATLGSAIAHLRVNVRFCQVRWLSDVRFRKVVLLAINVKF